MAAIAVAVLAVALPGRPPGRAFAALHPAAAPAGWPHLALPDGTAVLSYPPSLRRIAGDTDAGGPAEQRVPGIAAHLRACGPCGEDFEGLLAAVRGEAD